MKKNKDTRIIGRGVCLVPYRKEHVKKYHEWMMDAELRELTASEPLSLQQEYDMQQSWLVDENKCTFIVLDINKYNRDKDIGGNIEAMIGDVNLFFNDQEDAYTAEIEIMIAEAAYRGKGLGKEALFAMMRYGVEVLNIKKITAKIGYSNSQSLCMFQRLGFKEISRSDVFEEVTLQMIFTDEKRDWLLSQTEHLEILTEDSAS